MIKYSEAEANKIINGIIYPLLRPLATGPWNIMMFPTTNKGLVPIYKNLAEWRKYTEQNYTPNQYTYTATDAIYELFRHNISYWLCDNFNIEICVPKDDELRVSFADEINIEQKRKAIDELITEIKNSISYPDPNKMPKEVKEERRTMIDYTMDTAEKIINAFVSPCLEKMLNSDGQPHVIILPQKRDGLGYVFDRLDEAKRHSIDELGIETFSHEINSDKVYQTLFDNIGQWVKAIPEIKVCHLKDGNLRIRFEEDTTIFDRRQAIERLKQTIRQDVSVGTTDAPLPCVDEKYKEKKGEEKRMNDFSLTNLKDALVNKITHLDKKTITILALIALVLLVVGKYQDIKDILIGIKDKVKRSKNFKAMVADGTAAIDSLKKIVGVKDNKETTNEA